MDGLRFDSATRLLASGISRRALIGGIAGLLAGATSGRLASDAEAARKGPDACAAYCAGQPGARGAQCRQACKQCGNEPAAVCVETNDSVPVFSCCPAGDHCITTWKFGDGEANICCSSESQVCRSWEGLECCPPELGCCWNPEAGREECGMGCFDPCGPIFQMICAPADERGLCAGVSACWNPCSNHYGCGEPDEQGNCLGTTCFDPGTEAYLCNEASCFDPELGRDICGSSCHDLETHTDRCGAACWLECFYGEFCGVADASGECIDQSPCF